MSPCPEECLAPEDILASLPETSSKAPLVAFGQSPLWDEPIKAIVAAATDRPIIVGIHDLDYFSRLRAPLPGQAWQIIARNDGSSRDAWIAAGELTALFGSEQGPSRQALAKIGVQLGSVLLGKSKSRHNAVDAITESWAWRGIVQNLPQANVICDIRAADVAPTLRALLEWGFGETANCLTTAASHKSTRQTLQQLLDAIDIFLADNPSGSISLLFQELLKIMYQQLLGQVPENVQFTCTRDLLRFNTHTARRGRFRFVRHFLCRKSAALCRTAYDEAVAETGINTLAGMGRHATPFDLYVPGRGRGTLHIAPDCIHIDLPVPVTFDLTTPVHSITALAAVLEKGLGSDIALVGKAVALPAMFGGEFVLLLNETASAYIPRTRRMLSSLAASGLQVRAHPIIRLRLRTWDALRAAKVDFKLPPHLAQAFQTKTINSDEFARRWKQVLHDQHKLLARLGNMLSPSDFVEHLGHEEHEVWFRRMEQCAKANGLILEVQRRVDALRHQAIALRRREDVIKKEIRLLEQRRGELKRSQLRPLKRTLEDASNNSPRCKREHAQAEYDTVVNEGQTLLQELEATQEELRRLTTERKTIGGNIRTIERGAEVLAARRVQRHVRQQGERARLRLARNALLAVSGLSNGNLRPSAWWLHAVDPSGRWFAKLRCTARCRTEPLLEEAD